MAGISDSGSLQFWQGVAGVVGATIGGFFLAIGRRGAAKAAPEAAPAGDALQREILDATRSMADEFRGLRSDWQAKRDADEARRREQRDGLDDQLDDLRANHRTLRIGQTEIKVLLRELIERLPERNAARDRALPPPPDRAAETE